MSTSRWHVRLAGSLALCLTALCIGCQSVRGEIRTPRAQSASVPPLSASSAPSLATDSTHLAAAPIELVHGKIEPASTPPVAATEAVFVPALPTSPVTTATAPGRPAPPVQSPTPLAPALPGQTPQQSIPSTAAVQTSATCLPSDLEWRKQMEEQTAALLKRQRQMEGELATTRTELQTVSQSLKESQARIEQLNQEVAHWKSEVKRLETDMRTQQLADLKSLDELTESMHQVLLRQQGGAPLKESHP